MHRYPWENKIVLLLALVIAMAPLFSLQARGILVHGSSIGFAVPFVIKGTSRLRCKAVDVVLTVLVLALVLLATFVRPQTAPPLILEVTALLVIAMFVTTGLTFREIAREQRSRIKG